jgi:hypothetical protein
VTESEWLSSADPRRMLGWLLSACGRSPAPGRWVPHPGASGRKLRLFACACWRNARWVLPAADDLAAVDAIEAAGGELGRLPEGVLDYRYLGTAWLFADGAGAARHWVENAAGGVSASPQPPLVAGLLRDVFGNPFRICDTREAIRWRDWLDWNGGTVPKLARVIYAERRFEEVPVLADALEEAGCGDEELLRHCRGQGRCPECLGSRVMESSPWLSAFVEAAVGPQHLPPPVAIECPACRGAGWVPAGGAHVRGCWAVDLLAGRG